VRQELLFDFLRHWVVREAALHEAQGFLGLQVRACVGVCKRQATGAHTFVSAFLLHGVPPSCAPTRLRARTALAHTHARRCSRRWA
jgi:hypothetical protein